MTRQNIIDSVKQKLDELSPFSGDVVDSVDMIDKVIDGSGDIIQRKLPLWMLTPVDFSSATVTQDGSNAYGVIELPTDFLKLYALKMTDWQRTVSGEEVIDESHPRYRLQQYSATRGGTYKPVVAITWADDARHSGSTPARVLEYYSVDSAHTISTALYIKSQDAEDLADELLEPLAWQAAGDVLIAIKQPDIAQQAYGKVEEFIQNTKTKRP